jgi:hypothetical protein
MVINNTIILIPNISKLRAIAAHTVTNIAKVATVVIVVKGGNDAKWHI